MEEYHCEKCGFEMNSEAWHIQNHLCIKCKKELEHCDECGCECFACSCTTYGGCDLCGCGKVIER